MFLLLTFFRFQTFGISPSEGLLSVVPEKRAQNYLYFYKYAKQKAFFYHKSVIAHAEWNTRRIES